MKGYLWANLYGLNANYHDGGAVLIITDRDPIQVLAEHLQAQEAEAKSYGYDSTHYNSFVECFEPWIDKKTGKELGPAEIQNVQIFEMVHEPEQIHIFENAGCC